LTQARKKKPIRSGLTPRLVVLIQETALFVFGAVAFYMLLSLLTYSPQDPGWSHTGNPAQIANLGGRFGAWFADLSLHGFGYMAYLFPMLVAFTGWRMYQDRHTPELRTLQQRIVGSIGFLLTLIGGCGLENIHFAGATAAVPFGSGGVLGDLINQSLVPTFGYVGATVFLLILFISGITGYTGISWLHLMDVTGKWGFEIFYRLRSAFNATTERIVAFRARKARHGSVSDLRKRLERSRPPRIEPKITPLDDSGRLEREKQSSLFELPVSGPVPPLSLLDSAYDKQGGYSAEALEAMSRLVEKKLSDFNVDVEVIEVHPGPVITRFEVEPAPGVKSSQITSLSRDLARALSVVSVRVVDNIPGKTVIGLEVPNETRETVALVEGLSSQAYENANTPLALMLGKDIAGQPVIADLCRMPHLLIAGTTGSGKSVCINALILSMVYKSTPEHVRLIMIDPKLLELSVYEGIPHLLSPVVTDMNKAANALRWCIAEMERRYRLMAALGVRNISGYNRKVEAALDDSRPLLDPLAGSDEEPAELTTFPYIVVIIDELADLMMVVGKRVEELITRIAQRARAAGIHLILATQRPSVDVITGLIKANVPSRIAFQVSSRVDSRTVLDQMGAEQLLGHGDMLFLPPGTSMPIRVHGSYVSDQEVHRVADSLKQSGQPVYDDRVTEERSDGTDDDASGEGAGGEGDPLYDKALRLVTETQRASISAVQRQFRVGYNRAARMIEAMEQSGVVGPVQSNGKREVLAPPPPD